MAQIQTSKEYLPRPLRVSARVCALIVVAAGVLVILTMPMPWVTESYVVSHGPILSFAIAFLAMLASSLIDNAGPRVRRNERGPVQAQIAVLRSTGMSLREATRKARPSYTVRTRAGRIIGGGVMAAALGGLELMIVSYNLDTIHTRGYTPALGPDVATLAGWVLVVSGIAAIVVGIVALSAKPEVETSTAAVATGFAPAVASTPPVAFAPTHRVPDTSIPTYASPEGGTPNAMLDAQLPLMVIERRADWAHVRAVNGWEGWVDGRLLVSLTPAPPVEAIPPMPVG